MIVEKQAANDVAIRSNGRPGGRWAVYSIRYLTILIRMLPVWLSTW